MKRPTATVYKFIKLILIVIITGLLSGSTVRTAIQNSTTSIRPNIVFLIADDWSFPHAGAYGDQTVRTPTFDGLSDMGVLFENAYCAAPSCSPSRASILLGRYPHQLESAGNLWSVIPDKYPNWVSLLKESGYHTGKSRKGWGPGDFENGGYKHNPAGKDYPEFKTFLQDKKEGQPFAYWFGSQDPHRGYEVNTGAKSGMDADNVLVPGFLPDNPCVRNDIMDYYFEVERFDRESGNIIELLRKKGLLENTLIVMTSDNGMPFPRAKATLYDYGARMPLAIYWKGHIEGGKRIKEFMNFVDFAPTFLEAAGLKIPGEFSGNSLLGLFNENLPKVDRNMVFLERERHANVRKGNLSYPSRAIRTKDFLYIRNFEPGRWPSGDPEVHQAVGQYGDVDNSITKFLIMAMEGKPADMDYFKLAFGKRPGEEFYVISDDPYNLNNQIENPRFTEIIKTMRNDLSQWMRSTADLRATKPHTTYWDEILYIPEYQFENYNLEEKINEYHILIRDGGRFKKVKCEQ